MPTPPTTLPTAPPSAMVSEPVLPVPPTPTKRLPELDQREPAPVTVTVPCDPDIAPITPPVLATTPPLETVSAPVPSLATVRSPAVQMEPRPVTVTVPCDPEILPTMLVVLSTLPPFSRVSVPLPRPPTTRTLVNQWDELPVTVTVPCDPDCSPITPIEVNSVPPPWIVSWPVLLRPMRRTVANAAGTPLITVGRGVTVSIMAVSPPPVGTPAVQLLIVNQLVDVVPVQLVCAWAGKAGANSASVETATSAVELASARILSRWLLPRSRRLRRT